MEKKFLKGGVTRPCLPPETAPRQYSRYLGIFCPTATAGPEVLTSEKMLLQFATTFLIFLALESLDMADGKINGGEKRIGVVWHDLVDGHRPRSRTSPLAAAASSPRSMDFAETGSGSGFRLSVE